MERLTTLLLVIALVAIARGEVIKYQDCTESGEYHQYNADELNWKTFKPHQ